MTKIPEGVDFYDGLSSLKSEEENVFSVDLFDFLGTDKLPEFKPYWIKNEESGFLGFLTEDIPTTTKQVNGVFDLILDGQN
tara:strand:+ start:9199 stop:9441 length:243 start_codon:yes stop_codon:yes gene_type:complete